MRNKSLAKVLAAVLAVFLTVSQTGLYGAATEVRAAETADEAAQESGEELVETITVEPETEYIIPDVSSLPDNDELFAGYVNELFGGLPEIGDKEVEEPILQASRGERLSGNDEIIYNYLKEEIKKIADGDRDSTEIHIPISKLLGEEVEKKFSSDELDTDKIIEGSTITTEAINALDEKIKFDNKKIIESLLTDFPYELYWFDKTVGYASGPALSYGAKIIDGDEYIYYQENDINSSYIEFIFYVSKEYQGQSDTTLNQGKTSAAKTAKEKADKIVNDAIGKSNLEKLNYYRQQICELTEYNNDAAGGGVSYGDPWQLVYVFDNDPNTNVVCEGYSKAFQYLCDNTTFIGNIESHIVTGTMNGGAHMWNVVRMNDGKNYIADITNCDEGSSGYPNYLFLKGYQSQTEKEFEGVNRQISYVVNIPQHDIDEKSYVLSKDITYTYYSETLDLYSDDDIRISELEYEETQSLSVSQGNIIFGNTLGETSYTGPDGIELTKNSTKYTGTLKKDGSKYDSETKPTEAGSYTVTVTCNGSDVKTYVGSADFKIEPKDIKDVVIELGPELTYTGEERTKTVDVKDNGTNITEFCTVSGNKATNAGTYTLTVTANENSNYTGSATKTYQIAKATLESGAVTDIEQGLPLDASDVSKDVSGHLPEGANEQSYSLGVITKSDASITVSDEEVDSKGHIKANIGNGVAGAKITFPVTVTSQNYADVTFDVIFTFSDKKDAKLNVTEPEQTVVYGGSIQLSDLVTVGNGGENGEWTWESDNEGIAEVGDDGTVTTKKSGDVIIKVEYTSDTTYGYAEITLKVSRKAVTVQAKDREIYIGGTVPSLETPKKGVDYSVDGLVGEDELTGIVLAYKVNGVVQSPEYSVTNTVEGSYAIVVVSASAEDDKYEVTTKDGTLTVRKDPDAKEDEEEKKSDDSSGGGEDEEIVIDDSLFVIKIAGITLSPSAMKLVTGETGTLTLGVKPSNATETPVVTWRSSDSSVASVSDGTVTGVSTGRAVITASVGEYTAECAVVVLGAENDSEYSDDYTPVETRPAKEPVSSAPVTLSDGTSVELDLATKYDNAVTYTGGKIDPQKDLGASVKTDDIEKYIPELNSGYTIKDIFKVSFVNKKNVSASTESTSKPYFYGKITLSKDKKLKNAGLSKQDIKTLKKLVKAANKALKKKDYRCYYNINRRSVIDGEVTVKVAMKNGAIKTKTKNGVAVISKVNWAKFTLPGANKSVKLKSKDYKVTLVNADEKTVQIEGKRNFSGVLTVKVVE